MDPHNYPLRLNRHGFRVAFLFLYGIGLILSSGCQFVKIHCSYIEALDQCQSKLHAWHLARNAWNEYSHLCAEEIAHRSHFKLGFLDGFTDVSTGGDGCLPAIPPPKYWKYCYETAEGRLKINAYFQGFSTGVQIAYANGYVRSPRLPTSQSVYANGSCPTCPTPSIEADDMNPGHGPLPIPDEFLVPPAPPSEMSDDNLPPPGSPDPVHLNPVVSPGGHAPSIKNLFAPDL